MGKNVVPTQKYAEFSRKINGAAAAEKQAERAL